MKPRPVALTRNQYGAATWLTWLILLILPLQSFWLRIVLTHGLQGKPFFFLSFWYEPLLYMLFLAVLVIFGRRLRPQVVDWVFIGIVALSVLTSLLNEQSISRTIVGIRYGLVPVLAYLLGRTSGLTINDERLSRILRFASWGVVIFALVQLILIIAPGSKSILSTLQLQPTNAVVTIPQLTGSLPGPNQLASYLLVAIGLSMLYRWPRYQWIVILSLVLLFATFSRSAIIGLGIMLIGWLALNRQAWRIGVLIMATGGLVWLGSSVVTHGRLTDILTHGASQRQHVEALIVAEQKIASSSLCQIILGHGMGTAGPATLTKPPVFIPESWYLQVIYELGITGLALYAAAFWLLGRQAFRLQPILAITFLGLLGDTLFLHTFADNPAATFTIFTVLALTITPPIAPRLSPSSQPPRPQT